MPAVPWTTKFGAALLLSSLLLALALPSQAAISAAEAIALYNKGRYAEAANAFAAICRTPGTHPNTYYYYALTLHRLGDKEKARRIYLRLTQVFPNSQAAEMARKALAAFPTTGRTSSNGSGGASSGTVNYSDTENLPESSRIYFKPDSTSQMIIDAYVNNRPIKMLFDTGADGCAFGKNHLREIGMAIPTGKPSYQSTGVGEQGKIDTWETRATIRVGNIERKNIEIGVQEHLTGEPLLGQNFFNAFTYTIDKGSSSILFTRKRRAVDSSRSGSSSGGIDRNSVPFEKVGNSIMVVASVNGRPIKAIFDTGATNTVFAYGDMKNLGIEIPADAEPTMGIGIAGPTRGVAFNVQRMTLGPIDRADFNISVLNGFDAGHPLIGRSFLGEWQYTIDNDAKIIHFLRR
ncbi:MAG: aspartyl protease family protein [Candidatus Melainabacteria bacterium]|nr:aspartyl protease family protein [Candidatus Melainabacteria bacterium]